jgi:hypothetical protein
MCVCGHDSEHHHGDMVMNIEYSNATGESRVAGECEFYGWNEWTDSHCHMYWDKDNPDPDPYADSRPNPPSKERRPEYQRTTMFRWALQDIADTKHGTLHCELADIAKKALEKDESVEWE